MARAPHRFFFPGVLGNEPGETIALPEGESHHILNVLRLKKGQKVSVFDHRGHAWIGKLEEKDGRAARVTLVEPEPAREEATSRLMIAVALLKRRAMDWMIEKLSELDVASVQPLISERTVAKAEETSDAPPARWERIALAAAKQAGRNVPMDFYPVTPLADWLRRERPPALLCFAHKGEGSVGLGEWLAGRAGMGLPVLVAVGPEGGWTPDEVEAFKQAGFQAVSLGPLVLRAETAAVTVAAACRVML